MVNAPCPRHHLMTLTIFYRAVLPDQGQGQAQKQGATSALHLGP